MGEISLHATGVMALLVYCGPTFLALLKRHALILFIALINLTLGWTFLGWVFALVLALGDEEAVEML